MPAPPATLRATGLYADGSTTTIAAGIRPFAPQYPLWTDGAHKQRWIALPAGGTIDATRADAWQFPIGTRLWKEFSFAGRKAETRYLERTAAGWLFATYAWNDAGTEAVLAPEDGADSVEVAAGVRHTIPARADCKVCHGSASPVLGFSALQLSSDRDPGAPHAEAAPAGALGLGELIATGRLRDLDASIGASPRITARTPTERAALGYLHGNCGSCHRPGGAADSVGMYLLQSLEPGAGATTQPTTIDVASHFRPRGLAEPRRIVAGDPAHSVLVHRLATRNPVPQMPPFGTHLVDDEAVALVSRWIAELPATTPRS
jgi:mono/diheme cytochrome c family protein